MKKIEVVAAIIVKDKEVLCTQRNYNKQDYISYKYEFPGGKVESGETLIEALVREIKEELNAIINLYEKDFFMKVDHSYPDFNLVLHSYICKLDNFTFNLNEHINYKWCSKDEIKKLDWAAADIPIVNRLLLEGII